MFVVVTCFNSTEWTEVRSTDRNDGDPSGSLVKIVLARYTSSYLLYTSTIKTKVKIATSVCPFSRSIDVEISISGCGKREKAAVGRDINLRLHRGNRVKFCTMANEYQALRDPYVVYCHQFYRCR